MLLGCTKRDSLTFLPYCRSLFPLPKGAEADVSERFSIHFSEAVTRVYFGSTMMRETLGFGSEADRSAAAAFKIGVMGCSPLGEGTQVRFRDFQMDLVD